MSKAPYAAVGFLAGLFFILSARARARRRQLTRQKSRATLESRVAQRRERARARLNSYQELIEALARGLACDPDLSFRRFAEGFFRSGNFNEGLSSAFGDAQGYSNVDWRDWEGWVQFAERSTGALGVEAPFTFSPEGHEAPVEAAASALARWLEPHGQCLLFCGADTDSYSLFVLRRVAAEEILELRSQGELSEDPALRASLL